MKKGMCAVSVLCIFFGVLLFNLTGCGAVGDERKGTNAEKEKNFQLSRNQELPVTETIRKLEPADPECGNLIGIDKNYWYLTNDGLKERNYIRADRKTGSITEIASLGKKWKDWTANLQYGRQGDLYVGLWKGTAKHDDTFTGDYDKLSSPGVYRILKLRPGRQEKEIFRCETMGIPQVVSAGNHVALEINSGKSLQFVAIDLSSGKETEIFRSKFERKENGNFNGTLLMGMEYSKAVPSASENGICYQTCVFKDESIFDAEAGDNQFVFYDFRTGENRNLGKHDRPVEYVGGTEKMYVTCDYPSDLREDFVKLYLQEGDKGEWQAYDFEKEDEDTAAGLGSFTFDNGSGLLNEGALVVYNDGGYSVIDAGAKTYLHKSYSTDMETLEEEDIEKLDYKKTVTGITYGDNTFAFSTGRGSKIEIHEITKK